MTPATMLKTVSTREYRSKLYRLVHPTHPFGEYVTSTEDWEFFPVLHDTAVSDAFTDTMKFGTWIDKALKVCDPIYTSVTWGW